jgi:hypothetical protein
MTLPPHLINKACLMVQAAEVARGAAFSRPKKTAQAAALERAGAERWLTRLGPKTFTGEFAPFHLDFWGWYWDIRLKLLRGEALPPEEMAALLMWGRGMGKSSNVEWACIAEGALGDGGFVMYVSGTEKQAREHVAAVKGRLESSLVAEYYPGLSRPEIGAHGNQRGWRQDYLATASGWGILPIGLDQGIRGGRKDDTRFSLIVLDDIDDHNDSAAAVEKKLDTIARTILPAGDPSTVVLFAQNLIHEDSVLNQVYTRRSDVLSDRREFGPHRSFEEVELAPHPEHPGKSVIRSARPTWGHIDLAAARLFLSRSGRKGFMAEYQHEFDEDRSERVLKNWSDDLHVITWDEFERVYGLREIPALWQKSCANDWAWTRSDYHANVAAFLTVSAQNSELPGMVFLYNCMSFGAGTEADDVAVRILRAMAPCVTAGGVRRSWDELLEANLTRAGVEGFTTSATQAVRARRDTLARVIPPLVQRILGAQRFGLFRGSHEQNSGALKVYRDVYGLPFSACNPGADGGVEMLNHLMRVDEGREHPFRPGVMGYTRFFLIADEGREAGPRAASSKGLHDSDLARFQLARWRNGSPKLGEGGVIERGPLKMHDDFGNVLMMLLHDGKALLAAPLTAEERYQATLPPHLQPERVARLEDPDERARALTAQLMLRQKHEYEHEELRRQRLRRNPVRAWRELGRSGR